MTELEQLQNDVEYLMKHQKIMEDSLAGMVDALLEWNKDVSQWSEFLTAEMIKQYIQLHKHKKSDSYFKNSLKDTHKQYHGKFETLFRRVFGEHQKKEGGGGIVPL